ncbi:hypothetical protein ADUPG1_002753, partial [Aduncisulcus paluster]
MERMTSLAEHVSPKDREKFSKVYDPVKPEECWYESLIIGLFKSMEDLFDDIDDTPASVEPFRVELLDETRSVAEPYRQIRRDWKHEIQDQLIKMNDKGIIRESKSQYHCATVIQPKNNGKLRLCVDYRPINAVTKGVGQVLPRINDLFAAMNGMKYFA